MNNKEKSTKYFSTLKKIISLLSVLFIIMIFVVCGVTEQTTVRDEDTGTHTGKAAKYIFLFIGDGMALPQVNSAEIYISSINEPDEIELKKLNLTQFPAQGLTTTYSTDSFITDSAAAGTALACGKKTATGVISMDEDLEEKFETIAEMAKKKGMKIGIVSSVSIDHATPAVFYSHQPSREMYYEISVDLANTDTPH